MLELIANGKSDQGDHGSVEKLNKLPAPREILLFVAQPGVISESLLQAVRHEFPHLIIKQVEHIAAACLEFGHPVTLILIDASLLVAAGRSASDLARAHPAGICSRNSAARIQWSTAGNPTFPLGAWRSSHERHARRLAFSDQAAASRRRVLSAGPCCPLVFERGKRVRQPWSDKFA